MRFISQYPHYKVQVRPHRVRPLGDGTSETLQEGLYAEFTAADEGAMIYERERYLAAEVFQFHGSQQEQDEATPIDPIHRLSVLDTVEDAKRLGWTPEEVRQVENVLREQTMLNPNAIIMIEGSPIPAPFPNYDFWTGDAEELVLKLTGDGFDPAEVLVYEQQFGPNRPDVVEALRIAAQALEELTVSG